MIRDLSIRVFYIKNVVFGDTTKIENGVLTIKDISKTLDVSKDKLFAEHIKSFTLNILPPDKKNIQINTIMDFIPISVKSLGTIGTGITYTLHGVKFMLTGCDVDGRQAAEFGSSEGILSEQVVFNRAGTPSEDEYLIHMDVLFYKNAISSRAVVNSAHILAEHVLKEIRVVLKKMNANDANERHDYPAEKHKPNARKVVIIKEIAGQGAMYDTLLFPYEPSGFEGGYSIIDMGCMPVILTPNEYRDGAVRALY